MRGEHNEIVVCGDTLSREACFFVAEVQHESRRVARDLEGLARRRTRRHSHVMIEAFTRNPFRIAAGQHCAAIDREHRHRVYVGSEHRCVDDPRHHWTREVGVVVILNEHRSIVRSEHGNRVMIPTAECAVRIGVEDHGLCGDTR